MNQKPSRRDILKAAGAAGTALLGLGGCAQPRHDAAGAGASANAKPEAFRFVHLTDIHVQRELEGDKGFARALARVNELRPRPDFILTGGDLVYDVMEQSPQRSRELFELYLRVIADNTSIPVHNTLGNHDIFGWTTKEGVTPQTPGYGRAMAKDYLKLRETYYSFDHKGWRFIVLDNILPNPATERGYRGGLDGAQRDWLAQELRRTPAGMPVVVCEHIPTITVTMFGWDDVERNGAYEFGTNLVCEDAADRLSLYKTRNVKLSLSGHIHERDRAEYLGTTFINDGAVCGAWWKGPHRGAEEGFGVIDVRGDGGWGHEYVDYGWEVRG